MDSFQIMWHSFEAGALMISHPYLIPEALPLA
jgi:hypothetical protein